jgi:ferric-dicitrate binding protein FerR (iron transport regulator)
LRQELHRYWQQEDNAVHDEDGWERRYEEMMEDLRRMEPEEKERVVKHPGRWWGVAAAVLILATAGWYIHQHTRVPHPSLVREDKASDITPGGNKAILILGSGTAVVLDSVHNGDLPEQGGAKVLKTGQGRLVYEADKAAGGKTVYNTIVVPRGGEYQVVLPDGTHVWLNAVSTLKFPTAFKGSTRGVELTGEAYFEVAADSRRPFEVRSGSQTVRVLGTRFNVMAYEDEAVVRTTLLQGSVRVSSASGQVVLHPGQQARLAAASGDIQVSPVNVEGAVAWKNGLFQFDQTDLKTIMRQVSRWYDVEVAYSGPVSTRKFTGTMSRKVTLDHVLKVLALSDVHFKVEGRQITVIQ